MDGEKPEQVIWHETRPPEGMRISQIYTWAIDPDDGRVLIQDRGDRAHRFTLPGGRPEPEDADPDQRTAELNTAAREVMEESQVRIDTDRAVYLGYQEVTWLKHGTEPYAQVRYAAPITGYEPIGPDPDSGTTNRRFMTSLERAPQLLDWHETGAAQAKAALLAGQELGLPVDDPAPEGYRDEGDVA